MHYYPAGWCFVRVMEMSVCLIQNLFSYVVARPDDIDLDQVTRYIFVSAIVLDLLLYISSRIF